MPNYPYFGFPFSPYRNYNYNAYQRTPAENNSNINTPLYTSTNKTTNNSHTKKIESNNNAKSNNIDSEPYLFDLFGLKLYFDDILLVCLIFFLYNEGVKDEGLFFALILLLLT